MLWLARPGFALVVFPTGSAARGDCPAQADLKANKVAAAGILLERPGAAGVGEIAVDRPSVLIRWLLQVCVADKVVVRLPEVELRGPDGAALLPIDSSSPTNVATH